MEKQILTNGKDLSLPKGPELKKYYLYLVLSYNDGRLVEDELLQSLLRELISFTGGATRLPPCKGWWISNASQKVIEDLLTIIEVIAPDSMATELFFQDFAAKVSQVLEQESVLLTCHSVQSLSTEFYH